MKIVSFSLLNYARIFTGMGLYELNIDFSKLQEKEAIETIKLLYRFNEVVETAAK